MIAIDFQGGAHGNFLEFVCNYLAGATSNELPFDSSGAAHNKTYINPPMFKCEHFSFFSIPIVEHKVVSIQITNDDLLPLSQISLLRAGNHDYNNNFLEKDTYNKFNNSTYRWVLDNLISGFFQNQIKESYQAIKDPSWPEIETLEDFNQLPSHIKHECIEQHHLELFELSESHPDCPRKILREFFKEGFKYPTQHGFIKQQQKFVYDDSKSVFVWPFACFYNQDKFRTTLKKLSAWAGIDWNEDVMRLHQEFLLRQPYTNSKTKCDVILQKIIAGENIALDSFDLLEESYIWAMLENHYNCMIHNADPWYTNSRQLIDHISRGSYE